MLSLKLQSNCLGLDWAPAQPSLFCLSVPNTFWRSLIIILGEISKKKIRKFGHMSKLGVPYLPCSLVWTKMNLDKYSSVYPTYLPKKFGHFGPKVCYWILNFDRNIITFFLTSPLLYMKKNPECFYLDILTLILSGRP